MIRELYLKAWSPPCIRCQNCELSPYGWRCMSWLNKDRRPEVLENPESEVGFCGEFVYRPTRSTDAKV